MLRTGVAANNQSNIYTSSDLKTYADWRHAYESSTSNGVFC